MKLKNFITVIVLLFAVSATAQQMPTIPNDTAVRIGKLPNGLTYYIRHNDYPAHRANFYIAQKVGSIQENDDQRGLAHFLEHMCFNGTKHYPNDQVIRYLETLGVQFGSDLNAYTSIDQTVYRICNVPTTRVSALDSCILILKDWSNGLTLDPKEIDKERGVIHEEWRMRTSAQTRILERNLETLYPGSKYGLRMPIGKMEIVDNFKPKALRDYYEKWYRPDNQGIIIVGDVDVNRTEAKIKELFSSITVMPNAAKVVDEPVPDNYKPIIVVDKDKEQRYNILEIMFKHDAEPDSIKSSADYLITKCVKEIICNMLNSRFAEYAQKPESPFVLSMCDDDDYIFAKTKDAFSVTCLPKEGKMDEAIKTAFREVLRARQFGFTATEYERAKADYLSGLEKSYTNRNKRENEVFGDAYRDKFLSNEPIPSMEALYSTMNAIVPRIPLKLINEMLNSYVNNTDTNLVVLNMDVEKDGAVYATPEQLKKDIDEVRGETLTAYVDNVKNEPLITKLPKKGSIKKETENKILGYKELTLSNGAKVILKKTNFKDDEIVMDATSKSGTSILGDKDLSNGKLFESVISSSGLGDFNNTELTKALAGKQASVSVSMNKTDFVINGTSTPKDLKTLFQLTYLNFTNIKKDDASYQSVMKQLDVLLKNKSLSPDQAFQDSLTVTRFGHNKYYAPLDIKDLKNVSYDRILEIAKERTANARNFTFVFCGNFEEDSIRPLIEQYIASLPAGKTETYKNIMTMPKGQVTNKFIRKMETPKATAYMFWYNDKAPYTLDNSVKADAAGQILNMVYLKKIREDASAAYSAGGQGFVQHQGDTNVLTLFGGCPMKPEMSDTAIAILRHEVPALAEKTDPAMLSKVKEYMLKQIDESAKKNNYWIDVIEDYKKYGVDIFTNYKKTVEALTPENVSSFVKNTILKTGNRIEIIMLPDNNK